MRSLFRRKQKARREPIELEAYDFELLVAYHRLLVEKEQFEKRLREKAIRLSRRCNQPWVV